VTRVTSLVCTPSPSPEKDNKKENNPAFAQAAGFKKEDCEGEEESPKKISANACKWCQLEPCVIDDEDSREEGKELVDRLKLEPDIAVKRIRYKIYRMHARQLGYVGVRHILPRCMCLFVDKHFVDPDEKRTGCKPKPTV